MNIIKLQIRILLLSLLFLIPLLGSNRIIKTYKNGQKWYEGNLINGKVDGLFTFWYRNGQKSYEENYKNGLRNGQGTLTTYDGDKYEGHF